MATKRKRASVKLIRGFSPILPTTPNIDNSVHIAANAESDGRAQAFIHLADAARAHADALSEIAAGIAAMGPAISVNQAKA